MNKYLKATAGALLLAGFIAPNVNAADAPYGMDYSGGVNFSESNIHVDPELIDSLDEITNSTESDLVYSSASDLWRDGWRLRDNDCVPAKYMLINKNNTIDWEQENAKIYVNDGTYTREFQIKNVQFYDPSGTKLSGAYAIFSTGGVTLGDMYSDKKCENRVNTGRLVYEDGDKDAIYVETVTKLRKNSTGATVFDDVYYGITDIDASQSYKVLNAGNEMAYENLYTKSLSGLSYGNRNKFMISGNYIYSEGISDTHGDASAYVKLNQETLEEGLNVVFGFRHRAGSSTRLFAKQLLVQYESDDKGVITGIEDEEIISGDNPTGSSTEPNEGYELDYWTADKDVTLEDGTVIEAGKPLTSEEVMLVDVREDLVFTAIHKAKEEPGVPDVPDTGNFTGSTNGVAFSIAAMMAIGVTLSAWIIARINHKKVQFNKH